MTALSSIEYPNWLIIAGALLAALGLVGLALNRGVEEESREIVEAELDHVAVYNQTAKRKRRDRWAERLRTPRSRLRNWDRARMSGTGHPEGNFGN
jgi:hypothetical protein